MSLSEFQGILPAGYVAQLGHYRTVEDDSSVEPVVTLHVPGAVWSRIRDPRGWVLSNEVPVTLPFELPSLVDGLRILFLNPGWFTGPDGDTYWSEPAGLEQGG
jgi:hypothetical protein